MRCREVRKPLPTYVADMQNPCPINVPCVPCADGNPLAGNSSEAPDEAVFTGISFQSPPLPLGTAFQALGCVSVAQSALSLEDAELLATVAAQKCATATWTNITNGPGPDDTINPPGPPVEPPSGGGHFPTFTNTRQTGAADCPDGTEFLWTVAAGLFAGSTQAIANAKAQSYATQQAALLKTCLSALPTQVCVNSAFNQTITATGMDANEGANNWELLTGMLPPGISFAGSGVTGTFAGTATTPGIYDFSIGVTGMDGGHVQKFYTVAVAGINDTLPDATVGTAYSGALTTAGFTSPTFSLAGGSLPDGLTLNADGTVTGTPANDAISSTFTVAITDGVTGLVCTEDVSIAVAMQQGIRFSELVWNDPPDDTQGSVTMTNVGNLATVDAGDPPQIFCNWQNTGQLSYTGPQTDCHLRVVISQYLWNFGDIVYVSVFDQDSNVYINLGFQANPPGTYDFDFTIPDSVNRTIFCQFGGGLNQGDLFTGTFTWTPA